MRVAMSQVPCLHEHLANAATTSSYAASVVMVKNKELEELSMNSIALGAGLGIWGVVNLMEDYGNDNPGANAHVR